MSEAERSKPPSALSSGPAIRRGLERRAWGITVAYAVIATLWIYYSDQALALLVDDPDRLIRWSVFKGLAFVAVTSLLLLALIRGAFKTIASGYAALRERDHERILHEAEIERLSRLYAALSHVNQAIVRATTRESLFSAVCRVLVTFGGFRLAWIGWHEADAERILPVAHSGEASDFLDAIRVYADDRPGGDGTAARAFRSGRPYICNDVSTDPATTSWREEAEKLGFRAAASFPIRIHGSVNGLLSVYAAEQDFFLENEVVLLTEVATDISFALEHLAAEAARREAEVVAKSEKLFSDTIIESMPGILYLYTEDGSFLRWNRNFEEVSGYSAEDLRALSPMEFFPPEDRERVQSRINDVFESGESFVEARFRSRDGTERPHFFTGKKISFEGRTSLVGVGIDISERTRAESERAASEIALRELNRTLEDRVVARTEELRQALVRAESADRIKSAFLATMSHELRTPLNSIIGFTGIVLQELPGPLNPEQTRQLGMVQTSARHLLDLINDVLDLSKIEAGQLDVHPEPFALPELIDQVRETFRPQAERKGLDLRIAIDPQLGTVVQDRRRVKQVLLNLLNNGIKFTDEGSVMLEARRDNGVVHLRVKDTGMGLRPESLELLFQPFCQIDTGLSRSHEGTGLGLAICQRLAGLMGGEISVRSEWERGSEFTLTLPIHPNG